MNLIQTQNKPKVSVNIVNWNGEKYLKFCLDSILKQSYKNLEIFFIDNASSDNSVKLVIKNYPQIKILENKANLGYAATHNQGIKLAKGDYVLCLNPDVILDKDYIKNIISVFKKDKKIGAITGKLLQWDFTNQKKTDIIDSVGLSILKSHQVIDRGSGEKDKGQYNKKEEVFGVSGAAPIYSKNALEAVKLPLNIQSKKSTNLQNPTTYEYFDESFFSYKEDIDLSWRMRLSGFKCFYIPDALAFHVRQVKRNENLLDLVKTRKKRGKINFYSYRNHLALISKNQISKNLLIYFPYIFWYELKKFIYILFYEPTSLKALVEVVWQLPLIFRKRSVIMARKKIPAYKIRKWFN